MFIARFLEASAVPWSEIIKYEPIIGWKPKANLDTHYVSRDGDICHVKTDFRGWSGARSIANSHVVVFGDSFAFGYGVHGKDSFAEQNSHVRTKGVGAPGYNMVQELLLMRELAPELKSKMVVWFICLENDLYDNLWPYKSNFYKTPFLRSFNGKGDWEIVTNHVAPTMWTYPLHRSSYEKMLAEFCTDGFFSERAFSACMFLIKEGKDICNRAGAQLVVFTIPNKNQLTEHGLIFLASHLNDGRRLDPDYPDKRLSEICRRWGLPFVAGKKYLKKEHYKEHDTHWNEKGNRRIAEVLGRLYESYRP